MAINTPKFKSGEFKAALGCLKTVFDAQSLAIVLVDALERKSAEQIFVRAGSKTPKARLKNVPKSEIVGQITGGFFHSPNVAYEVMKELDRSCHKERHIVASIPEEQAGERVGSYRAIALKRERAKFVWALARDDRESVRILANKIINEFFTEVANFETAKAVSDGEPDPPKLGQELKLAKQVKDQAERLGEATQQVNRLETKLTATEEERAQLLVQMGTKERLLKQQSAKRDELEKELEHLREKFRSIDEEQDELEKAKSLEKTARKQVEELSQKVRRLEKLAGASESLSELQERYDAMNQQNEELIRENKRLEESLQTFRADNLNRASKHKHEIDQLKEELKRQRKHIMSLEERPQLSESPSAENSVNLFLDQANLAAIAQSNYSKKVNFTTLIDDLRQQRRVIRAVAFVVDNGGSAFEPFCETLRRSGWELRIKKPKRFSDGSTKADWDMGIAMEALESAGQAEVTVIASGDGDFAPLIRRLQKKQKSVVVASFPQGLSHEAREAADSVILLGSSNLEA
ncbi:MAG: NYN domain-containing protein [Myxococcota bacterium]|nr:NYN domain-containing protein [Myxococcota bacterium]